MFKLSVLFSFISHLLSFLHKFDTRGYYTGTNPADHIKKRQMDNRRYRYLSEEEAKCLLNALKEKSPQTYDMAFLSLYTGMRLGEIVNLTWDCVNFRDDTIAILDPKTMKNRYVFITPAVKSMLKKRRSEESRYVFYRADGTKLNGVSNTFPRVVKKLGLNAPAADDRNKVVFHTLRHTFASWLVQKGVDLYTVKELMGHSTIQMTERYAHLSEENKLRAAMRLFHKQDDVK